MSDLAYAFRSLRKSPGFSAVAVVIVAVGIAAATAMFSTVNAVILRPIALPEPDRLATVYSTNLARNLPAFSVSAQNYLNWKARAQSWVSLAATGSTEMNLTGSGEPEVQRVHTVTADFLPTLGVAPILGRNFVSEEDRPRAAAVAIISEGFWERRFGRSPAAIGRTLILDGAPYTIVGVTSGGTPLAGDFEVMLPLAPDPNSTDGWLEVIGRLKPGVTTAQADAEMKSIAAQIWREHPEADRGWSTRLVPFALEIVSPEVCQRLYVLLSAVGLLLLIACANLSNLILVRTSARAHELAIRAALGASRAQIVGQIVTESLIVTLAGGFLGVVLSLWAVDAMHALPLPRAAEISADARVLGVAFLATLLSGLAAGLGPALSAARAHPQDALKGRAPRSGQRSRLRDAMVVAQLAISLTLLVGATLLGHSFVQLLRVHPGFDAANVLTVALRPVKNGATFYEELATRIRRMPGVTGVGLISSLPLTSGSTSLHVFPQGESVVPAGQPVQADWRLIDGGYFQAMHIPLISGRTLEGMPPKEARDSVVLSASLAKQLWGDTNPVGRQVNPGGGNRLLKVVGVVGDVRSKKLNTTPLPTFYWSMHRFIYGPMNLVVRSTGDTAPLLPAIRAAVRELDPTVPLFQVHTLEELRAANIRQDRLVLWLIAGFSGVALLLAALGTYGVIAFAVAQRTQEIGIRIAVGAQPGDILRLVLGQGARLIAIGAAVGLFASFFAVRLLAAMLYDTQPTDLASFVVATITLCAIALIACWLPARRASRVDPLVALRTE